jgi:hypothetical protein
MAVKIGWTIIIGILNLVLKLVDMFKRKRGSSEYRKDVEQIKDDPVGAFDNMFGGGVRDDRPTRTDAYKARETGTDPTYKS